MLIVEDSLADAELAVRELRRAGFEPDWTRVETEADYAANLHPDLDLILSDCSMPEFSALRALALLRERGLVIPLVIVSGTIGEEAAVAAMKEGAADYLLKDRMGRLGHAVENALEKTRLKKERKQHIEHLRQKNTELLLQATALETAANSVMITDGKGNIRWVNRAFPVLTGYSAEEVIGKTPRMLKSGRHERGFYRDLWETILSGKTWQGEFINRRKNGSLYHAEQTITPVRSEGGLITHFIGIINDITARKIVEEELRATNARLRQMAAIVESSCDAILGKTIDGIITSWNPAAEDMFGYSAGEIIGSPVQTLIPPDKTGEEASILARIRNGEHPAPFETVRIRKDGQALAVSATISPVIDMDGKITGASTIIRDISERQKAQESLIMFRSLVDRSNDGIEVVDPETGRYLDINETTCERLGYSREEMLSMCVPDIEASAVTKSSWSEMVKEIQKTGFKIVQGRQRRKDGSTFPVEVNVRYVRLKRDYVVAVVRDITERRNLEEQLFRAQRLESIGTLAGGVAHDLNNILAPIMMSIEILKDTASDAQSRSILDTIECSAQRGADIVRQILSFARGMEGQRVEVQPKHLLKEIEEIIKGTFPRNIRRQFSIPSDTWTILGDSTQIQQILLNLCVNARDAMPDGGLLRVNVENKMVDAQYSAMNPRAKLGPHVVISVEDSGIGMAPNIVDKIFDPFFTTKEMGKGTGLGLSTVLAIVKGHEGFINVYSEPGKGATFRLHLPALMSRQPGSESEAVASLPRGNGETVMIIDDEASILTITSQTLEAFGYRVLTADNGATATATYSQHQSQIAVVLTDMMMPVMDGRATILVLKQINPAVRIIAASGLNANGDVFNVADVKYFLPKPFTAEMLLKTLRKALDES
jgi:PAS domain S-box-containing protein